MGFSFLDGLWDGNNSAFYNDPGSAAPATGTRPAPPAPKGVMAAAGGNPPAQFTRSSPFGPQMAAAPPPQQQQQMPARPPPQMAMSMHPPQSSHTMRQMPQPPPQPQRQQDNENELRGLLQSAMTELHKKDQAIAAYAMQNNSGGNVVTDKCRNYYKTLEILMFVLLGVAVIMSIVLIVICQKLNTVMTTLNSLK